MSLTQLKQSLQDATTNLQDEDLFHRILEATMSALHMRDEDVARLFDMSRPSISRWRNGRNAPHPAMRRHVYAKLLKRVTQELTREGASSPPVAPKVMAARSR